MFESNIRSIDYDLLQMLLEIEFHGGHVYQNPGVPPKYYNDLKSAPSKDTHFAHFIKNNFPAIKIQ
jgi:hypothetical protein